MNKTRIFAFGMAVFACCSMAGAAGVEAAGASETNAGGTIVLIFIMMLIMLGLSIRNRTDMRRIVTYIEEGRVAVAAAPPGGTALPQPVAAAQLPPGQNAQQEAQVAAAVAMAFHRGGGTQRVSPKVHMADPRAKSWGQSGRNRIQQSHNIDRKH